MQSWILTLPPLTLVPAAQTDLVRWLLTVKTMCCCANILVYSVLPGQAGDAPEPLNDRAAGAALEAAALFGEVDLRSLQFVDTICGVSAPRGSRSEHCARC